MSIGHPSLNLSIYIYIYRGIVALKDSNSRGLLSSRPKLFFISSWIRRMKWKSQQASEARVLRMLSANLQQRSRGLRQIIHLHISSTAFNYEAYSEYKKEGHIKMAVWVNPLIFMYQCSHATGQDLYHLQVPRKLPQSPFQSILAIRLGMGALAFNLGQKQIDLYEFKASLSYISRSRLAEAI